jgi:hypothetical protein
MSSTKKPLEELAEIFANNHKHNSQFTTGEEDRTDFTRIVFIIGAGASHSANGEYFLLGDEAANRLENKFHKSIWTDGALENKKRLI